MLSIFLTFGLQIKVDEVTIYEHLPVYGKKITEWILEKNMGKT